MKVIKGATVLTMAERDYAPGDVLLDQGKIVQVDSKVAVPDDCEVIDATGMFVLPGFIDVHCHIGAIEDGVDDANEMTCPRTPQVRVMDSVNPQDPEFAAARAAGFTMLLIHPGSGNVIGGQSVLVKTAGAVVDDMVVRQPAGLKFAFGGNPKHRFPGKADNHPKTRMGVAAVFRQAFMEARDYIERRAQGNDEPVNLGLEIVAKVLRKEIPARVHVARSDDILTVIRLCKEFDIDFTLEHVTAGHCVVKEILDSGAPCVIGPMFSPKGASETKELTFRTPGVLASEGVKVALTVDHPVIPLSHSLYQAAVCVKAGMAPNDALKAMTVNGAEIAGMGDRTGSIEPGKDADLVVMTGYPFDIDTDVYMTLVNGKVVFKKC